LGYDRQDLYLSIGLQTEHGREQESATSVKAGRDGTVGWDDETMSIKYSNAGHTVAAEARNLSTSNSAQPKLQECRLKTPTLNERSTIYNWLCRFGQDGCPSSPRVNLRLHATYVAVAVADIASIPLHVCFHLLFSVACLVRRRFGTRTPGVT